MIAGGAAKTLHNFNRVISSKLMMLLNTEILFFLFLTSQKKSIIILHIFMFLMIFVQLQKKTKKNHLIKSIFSNESQ